MVTFAGSDQEGTTSSIKVLQYDTGLFSWECTMIPAATEKQKKFSNICRSALH